MTHDISAHQKLAVSLNSLAKFSQSQHTHAASSAYYGFAFQSSCLRRRRRLLLISLSTKLSFQSQRNCKSKETKGKRSAKNGEENLKISAKLHRV